MASVVSLDWMELTFETKRTQCDLAMPRDPHLRQRVTPTNSLPKKQNAPLK